MPNDYGVVVARGNPRAELLAVGLLEVLLRGHKDICRGVEPERLACPLACQVVRHHKHGFAAQSQPLGLHSRRCHCEGLASTNLVRE